MEVLKEKKEKKKNQKLTAAEIKEHEAPFAAVFAEEDFFCLYCNDSSKN